MQFSCSQRFVRSAGLECTEFGRSSLNAEPTLHLLPAVGGFRRLFALHFAEVLSTRNAPYICLPDKLRHDFGGGEQTVYASAVQRHTGFQISKGWPADVGGHAGFIP